MRPRIRRKEAASLQGFWEKYDTSWDPCEDDDKTCITPAVVWKGRKKSCARHALGIVASKDPKWLSKK